MSATETITQSVTGLSLNGYGPEATKQTKDSSEAYPYANLLPHFSQDHYEPLTPFVHVDPGLRALAHPNPRAFLDDATKVTDLTPKLGTEIEGISLEKLDSKGRDQVALEVNFESSISPLLSD